MNKFKIRKVGASSMCGNYTVQRASVTRTQGLLCTRSRWNGQTTNNLRCEEIWINLSEQESSASYVAMWKNQVILTDAQYVGTNGVGIVNSAI